MTLVRFNNGKAEKNLNNLMEDFFKGFPLMNEDYPRLSGVPVNITETAEAYKLDVVAPGFEKADFRVGLDKNILTVAAEKKAESNTENGKTIMKEYKYNSFKRSFTVDEKIESSNIQAKYENGILSLNLPKKPEVKEAIKEITIQ